ncbi:MAG: four helix bundle protein [Candidatus Omnitrophica bacterium]|nr:four helix bundle protein [Candidatus Omnitrophota bacterium]
MSIKNYKDLGVWQKAMDLVADCYEASKKFPNREAFGLVTQIQRSAVSVPANVAEGHARQHTKEFLQHLSIACGSLAELETHLEIAARLCYLDDHSLRQLLGKTSEIGKMLNGLRRALQNKD